MFGEVFERSLGSDRPPIYYSEALKALWFAAKGDEKTAMAIAEAASSLNVAWVRAHLHRCARDAGQAGRWYAVARRKPSDLPIDRERTSIAVSLLSDLTIR